MTAGDSGGELRLNQRRHAVRERDPDVDLGQAEEAPVLPHHPPVAGERQHPAAGEGMTVDRRHGRGREPQEPCVECLKTVYHLTDPVRVLAHPVEVETVGEELALAGQDHGRRTLDPFDRRKRLIEGTEHLGVEPVLPRTHSQDGYVPVPFDPDHCSSP